MHNLFVSRDFHLCGASFCGNSNNFFLDKIRFTNWFTVKIFELRLDKKSHN